MRCIGVHLLLISPVLCQFQGGNPLSSLLQLEFNIVHTEGTFGSEVIPKPGDKIVVTLKGNSRLDIFVSSMGHPMAGLIDPYPSQIVSDVLDGNAQTGWNRRVVAKTGMRTGSREETTVLELVIRHTVEHHDENGLKIGSNKSFHQLRLHTLRDDQTVREYCFANATFDRPGRSATIVSDKVRQAIDQNAPKSPSDDFEPWSSSEINSAIAGDKATLAKLWKDRRDKVRDDAGSARFAAATSVLLDIATAELAAGYAVDAASVGLKVYLSKVPQRLRLRALELIVASSPEYVSESYLSLIESHVFDHWFSDAIPELRAAIRDEQKD
jgi:hypothetical protein